jgi:hypothetical protein
VTPNITTPTNQNITLTISGSDDGVGISALSGYSFDNGATRGKNTTTFSSNTTGTIKVRDAVGNISSTGFSISNIDTTPPYATNITYTPNTATNGSINITLTISELVQDIVGWTMSGNATTWTKSYDNNIETTIDFYDLAGNA